MYYHVKFAFLDFKISWYNAYDLAWVRRLLRATTPLRPADWTIDTTDREVSLLLDQLMADAAAAQPDAPGPAYALGQSPTEQIIAWANKSVIEHNSDTFKQVISLIIDHALDPREWPQDCVFVPHAQLLRDLRVNMDARLQSLPASLPGKDPIYGENLFHDILICSLGQSYRLAVDQSSPVDEQRGVNIPVSHSAPATPQRVRPGISSQGLYDDASPGRPGPSRDPSSIKTSSISAAPSSMGMISAASDADRSLLAFLVVELYNQRAISAAFVHRYIVEVLIHTPTECDLRSMIIIIDALGKEMDTKDRAPGPGLYTYLLRRPIKTNHDLMAVYMNRLVLGSQSELQTLDVQDECRRVRERRTFGWKQDPSRPSSQANLAWLYESPRQDESGSGTSVSSKTRRRNARVISDPDINFQRRQRLQAILPTYEAVTAASGSGDEQLSDGRDRPTLGHSFSSASFRKLSGKLNPFSGSRSQNRLSNA